MRLGAPVRALLFAGVPAFGAAAVVVAFLRHAGAEPPVALLAIAAALPTLLSGAMAPAIAVLAERITRIVVVEVRTLFLFARRRTVSFDEVTGVVFVNDPAGVDVKGLETDVFGVALKRAGGDVDVLFYCRDEESVRRAVAGFARTIGAPVVEWDAGDRRERADDRVRAIRNKRRRPVPRMP